MPVRGQAVQLTKCVSFIPSCLARAFICSTNSSVTPAMCSAIATDASFPLATQIALNRSSTVICSPSDKNTWLPPIDAA